MFPASAATSSLNHCNACFNCSTRYSLQHCGLNLNFVLCTQLFIYSHVAALPSKITRLHGGTNAWTHGQTTFRANRQYNLLVCFSTQKYTIRSIVCEASYHLVTRLQGHLVTRSLGHLVTQSLGHLFQHYYRLTNRQHQDLQVCFADNY